MKVTSMCDRRHSKEWYEGIKTTATRRNVLTPELPGPLQDPISRCLSGGPGIFS